MSRKIRLAALLGLVVSGFGGIGRADAQPSIWNGYQGGTDVPLSFVPSNLTKGGDLHLLAVSLSTGTPGSSISVGKGDEWTVDTGSTGVVITSDYLYSEYGIKASQLPQNDPGHITYTSSNLTYSGFYYPLNIGLYSTSSSGVGTLGATAQVPVLIATQLTNKNGRTTKFCPNVNHCTPNGASLEQFGIGFGRGTSGATYNNPLLNLTSVTTGSLQTMAPGYVVSKTGLQLGLSPAQVQNTAFSGLLPSASTVPTSLTNAYAVAATKTDWQTPALTMTISNASPSANGTSYGSILVDTGISNTELSTGGTSWNPQYNAKNPAQSSTIEIYLPGATSTTGQPLSYDLVYQGTCATGKSTCPPYNANSYDLSPVYPINSSNAPSNGFAFVGPSASRPSPAPFINTGTEFLNYFNIIYDPVSGFYGYQTSPTAKLTDNNPMLTESISLQGTTTIPAGTVVSVPTLLFAEFVEGYSGTTGPQTIAQLSSPGQVTMSGVISSAIICGSISCTATGLEIAGGDFVLTADNAYLGSTTIDRGATLALTGTGSIATSAGVAANGLFDISGTTAGASILTLAGAGTVDLGSQSLTLTNAASGFAGVIRGSGGLAIGGGVETLMGNNTYLGSTTIYPGATLALRGAGSIAASANVVANGTFDISGTTSGASIASLGGAGTVDLGDRSLTLTNAAGSFAGVIGGSGGLAITGGTQTLTGNNSYTGGTSVSGGATLAIPSDAVLGAAMSAVILDDGTLAALADITTERPFTIGAGGGSLAPDGFEVTLDGPVVGIGPITLESGTTSVNGQLTAPALLVAGGATLRGIGTIDAPTQVQGTLAPGNSPGTLSFGAPVTLTSGATTVLDIDGTGTGTGAGNYSRVVVTGAANSFTAAGTLQPLLRGISGSASNTYTPPLGQQFQVVSAEGGVQGSFAGLTQPAGLATGTRLDALYGADTITLVVTPQAYGALAQTGLTETANQAAVGTALDAMRPAAGVAMTASQAALYAPIYALPGAVIAPALEALAPTIDADATMVWRDGWNLMSGAVGAALETRRGSQPDPQQQTADGPQGSTLWVTALGQFDNVGSASGVPGYNGSSGGVAAGVDRPVLPNLTAGASLAFVSPQVSSSGNGQTFSGQALQMAVYGSLHQGIWFADAQADGLFFQDSTTRPLPLYGTQAQGQTGGTGGGGSLRAGAQLAVAAWQIEPSAGLAGLGLNRRAFTETQANAADLSLGSAGLASVQSVLAVRAERRFDLGETPLGNGLALVPTARLGWAHEFADTHGTATAAFSGGSYGAGFSVQSAPIGRDAALIGLGATLVTAGPVSVGLAYTGAFAQNANAQTVTGTVSVRW